MKFKTALILITTAASLQGCGKQPTYDPGPVSYADFAPWAGAGPATIIGQGFLMTKGGDPKTCGGAEVDLIPANDYVNGVRNALAHRLRVENADKALITANMRTTRCDAQGGFEFDNVPAGPWYVATNVLWEVPTQWGDSQEGGLLVGTVNAEPGVNKVLLANQNLSR